MDPESAELRRILLIDTLATRYHLLPSEVMGRGDTVDVYVMETALAYQQYLRDKADAKANNRPLPPPNIPINKLEEMIQRVRSRHNEGKKD